MTRTTVTLAVGLALVAIGLGVTLSGSPVAVVRSNGITAFGTFAETTKGAGACQAGETLPAGISLIRVSLTSDLGPRMSVSVRSGRQVLTAGVVGSGWLGGSVAVPVRPLARTASDVKVCFRFGPTDEAVGIVGAQTSPALAARSLAGDALPGRLKIEYLRAGSGSWWSQAMTVARRIGLGRAPSGTWIVLLLLALMGAAVACASWLTIRELR
jgi:hypothetical protein